MIRYITPDSRNQILEMWRICFGDSQPYFDIYFREKYRDETTLAYFIQDKVVASLQLLSYQFNFCDTEIPIAYISGACTLPEARKKGYMGELLKYTFCELSKKGIPLSLLVPEEEWLLDFYKKYDYAHTFDKGLTIPSIEKIVSENKGNLEMAYCVFDSYFRDREMVVQKTFDDFKVIVEEAKGYDFPLKESLTGMTRIIDAKLLLQLFAKKYNNKSFSINIEDHILKTNNRKLLIDKGEVVETLKQSSKHFDMSIHDLAQVLLGFHTSTKSNKIANMFPEHQPQMHYMLE